MTERVPLAERFSRSWREWNDAIAGLEVADYDLPVYRQWSLRDVMGHVYSYLYLALRHVRSFKRRKRLASPRAPSYSYFNRREAERMRRIPTVELRADMDAAYRDLIQLLPALSDRDLRQVFPAQWQNSKYHTSLRALLREEAEHLHIHAADVASWRTRLSGRDNLPH